MGWSRAGRGRDVVSPEPHADDVDLLRALLDDIPAGHPRRALHLSDLGVALHERFEGEDRRDRALIEEAIRVLEMSVGLTDEDDPARAQRLSNLGTCYGAMCGDHGELALLERAIRLLDDAVAVGEEPACRANRGALLCKLYDRTGRTSALEEGIADLRRAVAGTPADDPRREMYLRNLTVALAAPPR